MPGRTGFKTTGLLRVKKSKITPPSPNPSLFLLPYRSIAIQLGRSGGHGWVHPAAKPQDLSLLCSARCGFLGCFVLHRGAEAPCHVQELISVLSSCCGAALGTSELVSPVFQAAHGPWSPSALQSGGLQDHFAALSDQSLRWGGPRNVPRAKTRRGERVCAWALVLISFVAAESSRAAHDGSAGCPVFCSPILEKSVCVCLCLKYMGF